MGSFQNLHAGVLVKQNWCLLFNKTNDYSDGFGDSSFCQNITFPRRLSLPEDALTCSLSS